MTAGSCWASMTTYPAYNPTVVKAEDVPPRRWGGLGRPQNGKARSWSRIPRAWIRLTEASARNCDQTAGAASTVTTPRPPSLAQWKVAPYPVKLQVRYSHNRCRFVMFMVISQKLIKHGLSRYHKWYAQCQSSSF